VAFYDWGLGSSHDPFKGGAFGEGHKKFGELREDFELTIWEERRKMDLKQVRFVRVHSDIGGGYAPDPMGQSLSDIPLNWIIGEAEKKGLVFERHLLSGLKDSS